MTEAKNRGIRPRIGYSQKFRKGSERPPVWFEYTWLALPIALGFLAPWITVRSVAWVIAGFAVDKKVG